MKSCPARTCSVCGSELKPLFSSFFCPACEQAKSAGAPEWLSVEEARDRLMARLPKTCTVHEADGRYYYRWPNHDRVTIGVEENLTGLSVSHNIYMSGNGCPVGFIDGWLYFLGAR